MELGGAVGTHRYGESLLRRHSRQLILLAPNTAPAHFMQILGATAVGRSPSARLIVRSVKINGW
jgi:hypothetical protein